MVKLKMPHVSCSHIRNLTATDPLPFISSVSSNRVSETQFCSLVLSLRYYCDMRKSANRKADSKGGRKQIDEVMTQSTKEVIHENETGGELVEGKKKDVRGKRKRITNKEIKNQAEPRAKRARVSEEETEYFEEKRNLEDLWKTAYPVGIEWRNLDSLYELYNWDFKHLEAAFEEGGMLYGKKVFVFASAEPPLTDMIYKDGMPVFVPTVIVVESPFPPSDKLVLTTIQSAAEKIIPMKEMKMEWVPYIPLEQRDGQIDRMDFQIFCLVCKQRRAALRHLKEDRVRKFEHCLPYFYRPLEEDEVEHSTVVPIIFPSKPEPEPPVQSDFDWEFDILEDYVNDMIEAEEIFEEQKDEFKEFVKEQVREAKKAIREAKAARLRAIAEMGGDEREVLQNIRFYKFYPQPSADVVQGFQRSSYINRFYGKAHQVL